MMGSKGSSAEKVTVVHVQPQPIISIRLKSQREPEVMSSPSTPSSISSSQESLLRRTPPPPVMKWEDLLPSEEVEEEEEKEQFNVPRGKFPMGVGPYAVLGQPRKKPEPKKKKSRTPKPEPQTLDELLMSDTEDEEEGDEEEEEIELVKISERKEKNEKETTIASSQKKTGRRSNLDSVLSRKRIRAKVTSLPYTETEISDDDSEYYYGSRLSGLLDDEYEDGGVLFDHPDTIIPAKDIVGTGSHFQDGQPCPADLHKAVLASETRYFMESRPEFHYGNDPYFQSDVPDPGRKYEEDNISFDAGSTDSEEDMTWMMDGRTNKQLG